MFYAKASINEESSIRIDLTDENVYTLCPSCGAEHAVDLAELARMEDFDLFGTAVYCEECTEKRTTERYAKTKLQSMVRRGLTGKETALVLAGLQEYERYKEDFGIEWPGDVQDLLDKVIDKGIDAEVNIIQRVILGFFNNGFESSEIDDYPNLFELYCMCKEEAEA